MAMPTGPQKRGLSKNAWIGIGLVGAFVLIVVIGRLTAGTGADRQGDVRAEKLTVTETVTRAPAPDTKRDNTDDRFIALLEDKGVPIGRDDALMLAIAVCMAYKDHPNTTIQEASFELTKQHPEWSPMQSATFIGGAVSGYCPERRNF